MKKIQIIVAISVLFLLGIAFGILISDSVSLEAVLLVLVLFPYLAYCIILAYRLDRGLPVHDGYEDESETHDRS